MGWAISLRPTSATVPAAMRSAVLVDPELGPYGGVPTTLRWDRGLEFAADALSTAAGLLGCRLSPTPPYSPHLKGKVERLNRSVGSELLVELPFFTDGPRSADGRLDGPVGPPMGLDLFVEEFAAWVRHYNHERAHRSLHGQAPLERWRSDATPIRTVPAEEVRWMLLAGEGRTIWKDGIHFRGLVYVAPELNGRVGDRIQVRYMPHDFRTIEVFVGDRWLATARPQGTLTPEERHAILEQRRLDAQELARRQRRASRLARVRLAPITSAGPIEETNVVSRQQAGRDLRAADERGLRRLARVDLLDLRGAPGQRRGQQGGG
jgi:putative transposase